MGRITEKHMSERVKRFEYLINKLCPSFSSHISGKKGLDAGCWYGYSIRYARRCGAEMHGFDISKDSLKDTYDLIGKENLLIADVQHIPYKDYVFDFMVCSHVIEHCADDEKAIKEVKRVLKNEGILYIAVPNDNAFEILPFKPFRFLIDTLQSCEILPCKLRLYLKLLAYHDAGHLREYSVKNICKLLKDNRFSIISIAMQGGGIPVLNNFLSQHLKAKLNRYIPQPIKSEIHIVAKNEK